MNEDVFDNLINAVHDFERNHDLIILEVVKEFEFEVISMNLDDQLYKGIDSSGQVIAPEYAESTKRRKERIGQPTDRVTLLDKGDFWDSFEIDYRDGEFVIGASDVQARYLPSKYGEFIFGLTPENIDRLSTLIKDRLTEVVKQKFTS